MGLPCTQIGGNHALHNKHRYCSEACLVSHCKGLTPPPRPAVVERYLQTKLDSTLQVLLLSRGCDFEAVLNEGTRAPDMSRSSVEALAEEWLELKEKTRREPSPSLRKLAHQFESLLTKDLSDKIALIPKDATDRERKIFHLKATTVLPQRVVMDTADTKLSSDKVKKRNLDRVRHLMQEAERNGRPKSTEPTTRFRGAKQTGESVAAKKKRKNANRRRNVDKRENRLECIARLCVWYIMSLDFPETEADEEAESRFKEWQGVLIQWEAKGRYVDHNRESTFISARHQLKKEIVQDFFSRQDGSTARSDEFKFWLPRLGLLRSDSQRRSPRRPTLCPVEGS